jgi:hypothetical protein
MLHLQKIVGGALDVFSDLMAVSWSVEKGPQNKHVQSSLEKPVAFLCLLFDGRHSTLDKIRW